MADSTRMTTNAAISVVRRFGLQVQRGRLVNVECEDQTEVDYFWRRLSAVPKAEQCSWLKDKNPE